jgi:hypothetical protein
MSSIVSMNRAATAQLRPVQEWNYNSAEQPHYSNQAETAIEGRTLPPDHSAQRTARLANGRPRIGASADRQFFPCSANIQRLIFKDL